ncbi:MAG: hypothetical protein H6668_04655 [Ardenticatenaceae bacterium]|nr:hypothetical protein [Ardenticatenaceae bacterium]
MNLPFITQPNRQKGNGRLSKMVVGKNGRCQTNSIVKGKTAVYPPFATG